MRAGNDGESEARRASPPAVAAARQRAIVTVPARFSVRDYGPSLEPVLIPFLALVASFALFGAFVALAGQKPLDVYYEMYRGAFGTWFSFQNTLQRAAPLMLTALCTAIPARAGLVVIGGEGALVIGGLGAAVAGVGLAGSPPTTVILGGMFVAACGDRVRCGSERLAGCVPSAA